MADLTVHEVADQLGCSEKTIYKLAHKLRGYKVGRDWRFRQPAIDAFKRPVPEPEQPSTPTRRVPAKRTSTLAGWHDFD